MLTLWGRLSSINVQKVALCLEELGLPYERVEAGREFGIVGTEAYRRMNPNRLIPVIRDGDFVLWESNAIVRYLAAKHGAGGLWPDELRVRADADRWMDWQTTTFQPAYGPAFGGLVREPGSRPPEAIKAALEAGERMAAILDEHLADRTFVAGEIVTMGDVAIACSAHRWLNLPAERSPRPHLERYYRAVMERPAARKVLTTPIT